MYTLISFIVLGIREARVDLGGTSSGSANLERLRESQEGVPGITQQNSFSFSHYLFIFFEYGIRDVKRPRREPLIQVSLVVPFARLGAKQTATLISDKSPRSTTILDRHLMSVLSLEVGSVGFSPLSNKSHPLTPAPKRLVYCGVDLLIRVQSTARSSIAPVPRPTKLHLRASRTQPPKVAAIHLSICPQHQGLPCHLGVGSRLITCFPFVSR